MPTGDPQARSSHSHLGGYYETDRDTEAALSDLACDERRALERALNHVFASARKGEEVSGWAAPSGFFPTGIARRLEALMGPVWGLASRATEPVAVPRYDEEKPWNTLDFKDIGHPARRKAKDFLIEFYLEVNHVERLCRQLLERVVAQVDDGLRSEYPEVRVDSAALLSSLLHWDALPRLRIALDEESDPSARTAIKEIIVTAEQGFGPRAENRRSR